jgi:hypothetical protein
MSKNNTFRDPRFEEELDFSVFFLRDEDFCFSGFSEVR